MCNAIFRVLAALILVPALAAAQSWSSISLVTNANETQQVLLRDADGRPSQRITVTNLLPDNPITGVSLSGSVLTFTFEDGSTQDVTLPAGGGGGGSNDGVLTGLSFATDGSTLTATRSVGANVVANVPAALRATGGLTTDQARDTAGALVATLPTFTYNATSNTLAWVASSIPASYASASSTSTQQAWQTRIGAAQDWSTIPAGTTIRLGKVVEHGGSYFGAIAQHNRGGTGPDGDATNWVQISNWRGTWTAAWYPAGSFVSHNGLPWVAESQVTASDPAPDAATSTKWLQLGSAPTAVVIASSNTSIPTSANGNTYVHTGSSNITYTLPRASGTGAVANGWEVVITNQGAGDLTIDGFGSDTVDGSATLVLTQNGRSVRVQKIANSAWATIADTKDEVGTGGGSGTIADNSITPAKAQADTAVRMAAWRARLGSSKIDAGNALPAATATNIGDVHIFTRPVASGLSWRDISAPSTVITSANAGDIGLYLTNGWTRVGNVVGTGQNLLLDNAASPIAASAANAANVLYRAGNFYRNEAVHVADPTATYRAFATSDLPNTYVWGGAVNVNPTASTTTENTVIYSIPAARFERKITTGGIAVWIGYDQANWRGPVADESAADRTVQAIGDVVFYGGTVYVVTAYTARTPDRFQWTRIRDEDLIARVDAIAADATSLAGLRDRLSVFGTAELSPPGIPDRIFPEFMALRLDNRITGRTIIEIRVLIEDTPIATVNQTAALAPFNTFTSIEDEAVGPTGGVINIALNASTRDNLLNGISSAAQYTRFDIHYKFTGTSLATNVPADAIDRIHFGVNNNGYPAAGGGLTQSQVDARVLALRSLVTTAATPVAGDRFFFTDENQAGDPLRFSDVYTLTTALVTDDSVLDTAQGTRTTADRGKLLAVSATSENAVELIQPRTFTARTATAGASRTWTYTLAAADTEILIGALTRPGSGGRALATRVIPRAILSSTAILVALDMRLGSTASPDNMSIGVASSISGNTLTLTNTGWLNNDTPIVYSK